MKKIIAYPAGRWARELLSLANAERIAYFLDEDPTIQKAGFPIGVEIKPVYAVEHIAQENPVEFLVIITDSKQYPQCKERLESFGLIENVHFFSGWSLDINFYRVFDDDAGAWIEHEKREQVDFSEFDRRMELMASMVPDDIHSIMDMGCADQKLRRCLSPDVKYYGLDIVQRDKNTLVCNVNEESLPNIVVDAYYMAGFLAYVNNIDSLFSQMRNAKYLVFDFQNRLDYFRFGNPYIYIYTQIGKRVGLNMWKKYLMLSDVINALSKNGFVIEKALELDNKGIAECFLAKNLYIS